MEFMMPEWLSGKKILTAEEVKKLPVGANVYVHKIYGKRGEHLCGRYTVTQSENKKVLTTLVWPGICKPCRSRTARELHLPQTE